MTRERELVIGIGTNLGSREALARAAVDLLANTPGVRLLARAPLFDTAPVGPAQPRYLNTAALVRTDRTPASLLDALLAIERTLGRERRERWGPRTVDLDLLWIDGETLATDALIVPHAELTRRAFALAPLLALRPEARDPRDGRRLTDALDALHEAPLAPHPFAERFEATTVDHTADEGFITHARDRADILAAAAEAMGALIVDPNTVAATRTHPITVTLDDDDGDDARMFAWLSEVLFHLDARRLALRRAVVFDDGATRVSGALLGDTLVEAHHGVRTALKAVTWHALEVAPTRDGDWRAQVVVDV